jgi:hypothetical protein
VGKSFAARVESDQRRERLDSVSSVAEKVEDENDDPELTFGVTFPSSYGLRKTSASDGCQQSTATRAFSAAARKGTQSGQTRAAKSESQNRSSTLFWHSRHWPEVFFVKDLIA